MTISKVQSDCLDLKKQVQLMAKSLKELERLIEQLDLKNAEKAIFGFVERLKVLGKLEPEIGQSLSSWLNEKLNYIKSDDYAAQLENSLKSQQIPFAGKFPEYIIPPFRLLVDFEQRQVFLKTGRKSIKYSALDPSFVSNWTQKREYPANCVSW